MSTNFAGTKLATNDASFGYYKLDANGCKAEFDRLETELQPVGDAVAKANITLEGAGPLLDQMQALLSQRGEERKKVLKEAGLPTWTKWVKEWTEELDISLRTIQRHIQELRADKKPCPDCGKPRAECTCPERCSKCGCEEADCTCVKDVAVPEPYLKALEQLAAAADRAADRHEDEELADAVKYAMSGKSRNEQLKLGIQPKPDLQTGHDSDSNRTPQAVADMFLTKQVQREFLTAVTEESELLIVLREFTRIFYQNTQTPESERDVLVESKADRKKAHSESIKAGWERKKAAQDALHMAEIAEVANASA